MAKNLQQVHEGNALNRDVIATTLPLLLMAFFFYGPKVIAMALVGVLSARICDRLAAFLRNQKYDRTENSSLSIALIIVLMLPATVGYHVVAVSVVVAILIGKEAFGGYKSYPFNPSAVGFCVAAVSWPKEVLRYPIPQNWPMYRPFNWEQIFSIWRFEGVVPAEGPSYILKHGGLPSVDTWSLLLGDYAGPLGVTATLVILSCAAYLLVKKRVSLSASLAFMGTAALIAFFFPRYNEISWASWPVDIVLRLNVVKYELLSGAMLFSAIFLVNEPATLPRHKLSRFIYGVLIGFATMMFRYFGTYELGACFAILVVNAVSGYFDRAVGRGIARRKGESLP